MNKYTLNVPLLNTEDNQFKFNFYDYDVDQKESDMGQFNHVAEKLFLLLINNIPNIYLRILTNMLVDFFSDGVTVHQQTTMINDITRRVMKDLEHD